MAEQVLTAPAKVCTPAGNSDPGFGKPIYPATGTERYTASTELAIGWQSFTLTYDTVRRAALLVSTPGALGTDLPVTDPPAFGELWLSSLHKQLVIAPAMRAARVSRGDGHVVSFVGNGTGTFTPTADVNDRLLSISGGYRFIDAAGRAEETYSGNGVLTRIDHADGQSLVFTYSTTSTPVSVAPAPGFLLQVQDNFGRTVQFLYSTLGLVSKVIGPAGQTIQVSYDANNNLSHLTWPDNSTRQFVYENASLPWAMTGIVDENNSRYSTIGYDSAGRAISSQLANGVDAYSVAYAQPPAVVVSDTDDTADGVVLRTRSWQIPTTPLITFPNGSTSTFGITGLLGMPYVTSRSQQAGSGCGASTSDTTYDANGNVASADDFNGNRVCYSNDPSRNLETARVEGLANTAVCSGLTTSGASLPAGSRKISTQWHPNWRLEVQRAEPGKLTTSVYNGQPDPFNGGATASCAPNTALLPDGLPIVVLCKRVEQATTDSDGHLGFSAALQTGVANRQQSWTYNQYGQMLTAKGPRTDVNDTTTYAYYANTTANYTMGDLSQVTNAAGQITQYPTYNPSGLVLQAVDANGIVTNNTYDLRQRLTSTTTGGLQTSYAYDPAGQLTKLTLPKTTMITYTWDAAHRLTQVTDQAGNSVTYTLDNSGNRIQDQIKDPQGNLARTISRAFDALGRVQQITGGMQ